MDFIKSFGTFLSKLFGGIVKNILYVLITAGLVCLAIGYTDILWNADNGFKEFFKVVGTTVLASGVFMAIAKSHQFTNIFKDELRKVIYANEHLHVRNDIQDLWLKVSDALCKQKFAINKDLLEKVKENYLPMEEEFYYKRFELVLDYEFVDGEEGYIECEETTIAEIVVHDPDGYNLKFTSWIPIPVTDNDRTTYELTLLEINGKPIEDPMDSECMQISKTKKELKVNFDMHFEEVKKTYTIKRTIRKVYALDSNPFDIHIAAWLYKCFKLRITYPKDLKIDFAGVGVIDQWKKTIKNKRRHHNELLAEYNGFVFKNQGFIIIFRKQ